jgi:hypothetical protein
MASGQSRSAREIGIADRTPNFLVSYEAEHTTPRLPAAPPTIRNGALPAPSGSTMRATATKNASASTRRIRLGDVLGWLTAQRYERPFVRAGLCHPNSKR